MKLVNYYGKHVNIVNSNGQKFYGKVNDHFDPDDNENGLESIVINTPDNRCIEFSEEDIETITIV